MKITSADTIQSSEREFIDFINGELDWSAIEEMILEKHKLQLQDEVVYKQGDIVVYNNQIAYKLDFDIKVSLSLIFNRQGDCLDIKTSDSLDSKDGEDKFTPFSAKETSKQQNNWSNMASNIAEMINDINQDS